MLQLMEPLKRLWMVFAMTLGIVALVFIEQTWVYCHPDGLLVGIHSDGPFHYFFEMFRLDPASFPGDLAVQSNRNLGSYEYFYSFVVMFTRVTGLSLLTANLVLCWLGNSLYLAGVMFLLRQLGARSLWAAVGTLLAAQPFMLISMSSGVTHSLAIPREVAQWPVPWLLAWFLTGRREGVWLMVFYGVIGLAFGCAYPLWAVLMGVAFGLADAVRLAQQRDVRGFLWLGAGALICMALVAIPSMATYRVVTTGDDAALDYFRINLSVYFTKGFRRLLIFIAVGWTAFRMIHRWQPEFGEPLRRLQTLFVVALVVCLFYEPCQRLVPVISLLFPGRLSLLAYLISMVGVALALDAGFHRFSQWGKVLVWIGITGFCLYPVADAFAAAHKGAAEPIPAQPDFVAFCRQVRQTMPVTELAVVPPLSGTHYFRVYAERSLWISDKDIGVLSRTHQLYEEGYRRLKVLQAIYGRETTDVQRESMLQDLKTNGVHFLVVDTDQKWMTAVSWPMRLKNGKWELRVAPAEASTR